MAAPGFSWGVPLTFRGCGRPCNRTVSRRNAHHCGHLGPRDRSDADFRDLGVSSPPEGPSALFGAPWPAAPNAAPSPPRPGESGLATLQQPARTAVAPAAELTRARREES